MAARLLVGALRVTEYVDADVFARALPRSEAAAITTGRAVLHRLDELATERRSFGFETTPASRSFGPRIQRLIAAGYECHLVFLWLPSADFAVARVADRVRLGGHTVPETTIRRRYNSGRNFFSLYQALTTTWRMYDNSVDQPRLVASGAGRATTTVGVLRLLDRSLGRAFRDYTSQELDRVGILLLLLRIPPTISCFRRLHVARIQLLFE
jgi:predicted ABC-type ATPase